ncbi:cell wall-binding repeat-containing protein [Fusobacterium gastrosuis]|uniref:cell wall-binding repeat-containing protein n=1 Tax=Fusobacterium gastrosuis TaxID=1755100 RepID=UPI002AA01BDD|nr:cell wall-binding repeat-containing protein [Fusobacterium gastrosuis]
MRKICFSLIFILSIIFLTTTSQARDIDMENVIVVSKQSPSDILPAVTLSNYIGTDFMLLDKEQISNIKFDKNKNYILVGGKRSLNDNLFKDLNYIRISGENRYETSISVLEYANKHKKVDKVNLVSGNSYADSSIVASSKNISILVSDNIETNTRIKNILDSMGILDRVVVGGNLKISDDIVSFFNSKRISGKDRYDTSRIFSGINNNGYIYSESGSYFNNIMDARQSLIESKGFILKNSTKIKIIFTLSQVNSRQELSEFLIENDKKLLKLYNDINKGIAENNKSKLITTSPTNTAYAIKIIYNKDILYIADKNLNDNHESMHIAISKNSSHLKEYIVKDNNLIKQLVDSINHSIYSEYSL